MSVAEQDKKAITRFLTKQMGFLFIGRGFAFLFTFFIPIILARIFSMAELGLYRQVFLIHGTLLMILPVGFGPSLYYFIPKDFNQKNIYISQTILVYIILGGIVLLLSFILNEWVSNLLNSSELKRLLPLITLFTVFMLLSTLIEIIMISSKEAPKASLIIFVSDGMRAIIIICATVFLGTVDSIIYGMMLIGTGRLILLIIYLYKMDGFSFSSLRLNPFLSQLYYALPLAFAGISFHFAQSIHLYIVSHFYDVSSFSIYSIGFLQIPLLWIIFDSVIEAAMVKIAEFDKEKKDVGGACLVISDAVKKLSLAFFPIFVFLVINAKEIIIVLYTVKFKDSIPIFIVSIFLIPIEVMNMNFVLRAFGRAKFLLISNVIKLILTILFVIAGLNSIGLMGAALGVGGSFIVGNLIILIKVKYLMKVGLKMILPLEHMVKIMMYSAIAGVCAILFKVMFSLDPVIVLLGTMALFGGAYCVLIYRSRMASEELKMLYGLGKRMATKLILSS